MADTYTQLHIHLIFAVKGRQNLVQEAFREELEKYISGIVRNKRHKLLALYCMPDHAHLLIGLNPAEALSTLVRDIKANSSQFINEKRWVRGRFSWQEGYGAFSYARSQVDTVVEYIRKQPQHHQKRTFREEYLSVLENFGIEYKTEYLFEWIDKE